MRIKFHSFVAVDLPELKNKGQLQIRVIHGTTLLNSAWIKGNDADHVIWREQMSLEIDDEDLDGQEISFEIYLRGLLMLRMLCSGKLTNLADYFAVQNQQLRMSIHLRRTNFTTSMYNGMQEDEEDHGMLIITGELMSRNTASSTNPTDMTADNDETTLIDDDRTIEKATDSTAASDISKCATRTTADRKISTDAKKASENSKHSSRATSPSSFTGEDGGKRGRRRPTLERLESSSGKTWREPSMSPMKLPMPSPEDFKKFRRFNFGVEDVAASSTSQNNANSNNKDDVPVSAVVGVVVGSDGSPVGEGIAALSSSSTVSEVQSSLSSSGRDLTTTAAQPIDLSSSSQLDLNTLKSPADESLPVPTAVQIETDDNNVNGKVIDDGKTELKPAKAAASGTNLATTDREKGGPNPHSSSILHMSTDDIGLGDGETEVEVQRIHTADHAHLLDSVSLALSASEEEEEGGKVKEVEKLPTRDTRPYHLRDVLLHASKDKDTADPVGKASARAATKVESTPSAETTKDMSMIADASLSLQSSGGEHSVFHMLRMLEDKQLPSMLENRMRVRTGPADDATSPTAAAAAARGLDAKKDGNDVHDSLYGEMTSFTLDGSSIDLNLSTEQQAEDQHVERSGHSDARKILVFTDSPSASEKLNLNTSAASDDTTTAFFECRSSAKEKTGTAEASSPHSPIRGQRKDSAIDERKQSGKDPSAKSSDTDTRSNIPAEEGAKGVEENAEKVEQRNKDDDPLMSLGDDMASPSNDFAMSSIIKRFETDIKRRQDDFDKYKREIYRKSNTAGSIISGSSSKSSSGSEGKVEESLSIRTSDNQQNAAVESESDTGKGGGGGGIIELRGFAFNRDSSLKTDSRSPIARAPNNKDSSSTTSPGSGPAWKPRGGASPTTAASVGSAATRTKHGSSPGNLPLNTIDSDDKAKMDFQEALRRLQERYDREIREITAVRNREVETITEHLVSRTADFQRKAAQQRQQYENREVEFEMRHTTDMDALKTQYAVREAELMARLTELLMKFSDDFSSSALSIDPDDPRSSGSHGSGGLSMQIPLSPATHSELSAMFSPIQISAEKTPAPTVRSIGTKSKTNRFTAKLNARGIDATTNSNMNNNYKSSSIVSNPGSPAAAGAAAASAARANIPFTTTASEEGAVRVGVVMANGDNSEVFGSLDQQQQQQQQPPQVDPVSRLDILLMSVKDKHEAQLREVKDVLKRRISEAHDVESLLRFELSELREQLSKSIAESTGKITAMEKENAEAAKAASEKLSSTIRDGKAKLAKEREEHAKKTAQIEAGHQHHLQEVENMLKFEIGDLKGHLSAKEKEVAELKARVADLRTSIDHREIEVSDQMEEIVEGWQKKMRDIQNQIETDRAEATSTQKELEQRVAEFQQREVDLKTSIKEGMVRLQESKDDAAVALAQEEERHKSEVKNLQDKIARILKVKDQNQQHAMEAIERQREEEAERVRAVQTAAEKREQSLREAHEKEIESMRAEAVRLQDILIQKEKDNEERMRERERVRVLQSLGEHPMHDLSSCSRDETEDILRADMIALTEKYLEKEASYKRQLHLAKKTSSDCQAALEQLKDLITNAESKFQTEQEKKDAEMKAVAADRDRMGMELAASKSREQTLLMRLTSVERGEGAVRASMRAICDQFCGQMSQMDTIISSRLQNVGAEIQRMEGAIANVHHAQKVTPNNEQHHQQLSIDPSADTRTTTVSSTQDHPLLVEAIAVQAVSPEDCTTCADNKRVMSDLRDQIQRERSESEREIRELRKEIEVVKATHKRVLEDLEVEYSSQIAELEERLLTADEDFDVRMGFVEQAHDTRMHEMDSKYTLMVQDLELQLMRRRTPIPSPRSPTFPSAAAVSAVGMKHPEKMDQAQQTEENHSSLIPTVATATATSPIETTASVALSSCVEIASTGMNSDLSGAFDATTLLHVSKSSNTPSFTHCGVQTEKTDDTDDNCPADDAKKSSGLIGMSSESSGCGSAYDGSIISADKDTGAGMPFRAICNLDHGATAHNGAEQQCTVHDRDVVAGNNNHKSRRSFQPLILLRQEQRQQQSEREASEKQCAEKLQSYGHHQHQDWDVNNSGSCSVAVVQYCTVETRRPVVLRSALLALVVAAAYLLLGELLFGHNDFSVVFLRSGSSSPLSFYRNSPAASVTIPGWSKLINYKEQLNGSDAEGIASKNNTSRSSSSGGDSDAMLLFRQNPSSLMGMLAEHQRMRGVALIETTGKQLVPDQIAGAVSGALASLHSNSGKHGYTVSKLVDATTTAAKTTTAAAPLSPVNVLFTPKWPPFFSERQFTVSPASCRLQRLISSPENDPIQQQEDATGTVLEHIAFAESVLGFHHHYHHQYQHHQEQQTQTQGNIQSVPIFCTIDPLTEHPSSSGAEQIPDGVERIDVSAGTLLQGSVRGVRITVLDITKSRGSISSSRSQEQSSIMKMRGMEKGYIDNDDDEEEDSDSDLFVAKENGDSGDSSDAVSSSQQSSKDGLLLRSLRVHVRLNATDGDKSDGSDEGDNADNKERSSKIGRKRRFSMNIFLFFGRRLQKLGQFFRRRYEGLVCFTSSRDKRASNPSCKAGGADGGRGKTARASKSNHNNNNNSGPTGAEPWNPAPVTDGGQQIGEGKSMKPDVVAAPHGEMGGELEGERGEERSHSYADVRGSASNAQPADWSEISVEGEGEGEGEDRRVLLVVLEGVVGMGGAVPSLLSDYMLREWPAALLTALRRNLHSSLSAQ